MKYRRQRGASHRQKARFFFALFKCECVLEIKTWLGFMGLIGIFIFIFFIFLMRPVKHLEAKKTYAFGFSNASRKQCTFHVQHFFWDASELFCYASP